MRLLEQEELDREVRTIRECCEKLLEQHGTIRPISLSAFLRESLSRVPGLHFLSLPDALKRRVVRKNVEADGSVEVILTSSASRPPSESATVTITERSWLYRIGLLRFPSSDYSLVLYQHNADRIRVSYSGFNTSDPDYYSREGAELDDVLDHTRIVDRLEQRLRAA